jgi:tetratricopeptide (TPR) repeat protein
MDWKEYEDAICEALRQVYPNATIRRNVKLPGRYSRTKRQIDVLVEYYLLGKPAYIIIDAKKYNETIDVKDVDSFIGMIQDVGAVEGILVTEKGYSKAAIAAAHNSPTELTLEIYNLQEIKHFQGQSATVHSGIRGVLLPAPFGWVIDSTSRQGSLAMLYQRGKIFEEAAAAREFMYVNIYTKTPDIQNASDLIALQNKYLKKAGTVVSLSDGPAIQREDKRPTLLRKAVVDTYPALEYTGFVDFEEYIFFCVLFTPEALQARNVRKIQSVLEKSLPVDMTDSFSEWVKALEVDLAETVEDSAKVEILFSQGKLLRQIKLYKEAESKLNASLALATEPTDIENIYLQKSINAFQARQDEVDLFSVLSTWLDTQSTSSTAVLRMLDSLSGYDLEQPVLRFLAERLKAVKSDTEQVGFIQYQLAYYYMMNGRNAKARQAFSKSKSALARTRPPDDEVFAEIEKMLSMITSIK